MIKKRYILLSLTSGLLITMLLANSAVASNQLEQRIKLLEKLDMLDSLDFQDLINAANECTVQRNFDCSRNKINEADKLAATQKEKKALSLAMTDLNSEIEQVRLEEIARQEELARIERERIRQEQLRLARVEEERRRKQAKEDDNLGKWLGVGARMLGSGLGASAAGTSFDTQAWNDISVGAMEDGMGGGTGMSSTTAALNKTGERYRQERQQTYKNNIATSQASLTRSGADNGTNNQASIKNRYGSYDNACTDPNVQVNSFCKLANTYYDQYVKLVQSGQGDGEQLYNMHKSTVLSMTELKVNSKNRTSLMLGGSASGECIHPSTDDAINFEENMKEYNECRRINKNNLTPEQPKEQLQNTSVPRPLSNHGTAIRN